MSRETERQLVTGEFKAFWDTTGLPAAYPNKDFVTPDNSMFGVMNLVDRGSSRESIGRHYLKRHRGTLQIDIYIPGSEGTAKGRVLADRIEARFDSLDLVTTDGEPVSFRTTSAREVGGNEARAGNLDDNWSRYIVECPYDRTEIIER